MNQCIATWLAKQKLARPVKVDTMDLQLPSDITYVPCDGDGATRIAFQ